MHISPRVKFFGLIGSVFLIGWVRISLVFSLGDKNTPLDTDEFAANIQQTLPEELEENQTQKEPLPSQEDLKKQNTPTRLPQEDTQQNDKTQQVGSQITVLVPPLLDKAQRKTIQTTIDNNSQQQTRLLYYPSRDLYTQAVSQALDNKTSHDIILIPSPWFQSWQGKALIFSLNERIRSVFHPMMHARLFHDTMSIIPFSLDPFVVISHDSGKSYATTAEIISTRNTSPQSFGFGSHKDEALSSWSQFANQVLVHHALLDAARTGAKRRISFLLLPGGFAYQENCTHSQPWCAFLGEQLDATIGPLSLLNNVQKEVSIHALPGDPSQYPVLGRGFVVPLSSDNQQAASQWLSTYISLSSKGAISYPPHIFSASLRTLQRQRIEQKYSSLTNFFNMEDVLTGYFTDSLLTDSFHLQAFFDKAITINQLLQKIGDSL